MKMKKGFVGVVVSMVMVLMFVVGFGFTTTTSSVSASAASRTQWVDVLESGGYGYARNTFMLQSKACVLTGRNVVKIEKGTVVKILNESNGWYKIEVYPKGDRYVGYIGEYGISEAFPCVKKNFRVIATAGLNVRAKMSTSSKKLGSLKYNTKVTVLRTSLNGWSEIQYKGKTGYIATRYLKLI